MRRGVGEAVLALLLGLAPAARADVYAYRDRHGNLYYTNVPAEAGRLVFKERPIPAAAPMLVPRRWLPELRSSSL